MTDFLDPTDRIRLACSLAGCDPDTLLSSRAADDGGAVIVCASGQKYRYTWRQLAAELERLEAIAADQKQRERFPEPDPDPADHGPLFQPTTARPAPPAATAGAKTGKRKK